MRTILLDGSRYNCAHQLHSALKRLLDLPDYYGMNADALNDCLSEKTEPVHLWIASYGEGETASAMKKIAAVILDNGGTVKELMQR